LIRGEAEGGGIPLDKGGSRRPSLIRGEVEGGGIPLDKGGSRRRGDPP